MARSPNLQPWVRRTRHASLWLGRTARQEIAVLLLLGLLACSAWAFAEIADEVMEGETGTLDRKILLAMRTPDDLSDPIGPAWLEEVGRDVTALGGNLILTLITLAVAGLLVLRRRMRTMLLVIAASGGGLLLSSALKYGFDRPRPDLVAHGSYVYTASFPSGHSMMAAVIYLTLAALLARTERRKLIKAYLISVAVLITVMVGLSRVYLGVHWPTDVLAGWAVGAGWASLCWLAARWLQREGAVEPENLPEEA